MHIHDIETVAIWCFLVNAVMLLTLLMPRLVSAPSRRDRLHGEWQKMPAQDELDEPRGAMVLIGKVPDVYVVSTSWAWGTPRAAPKPAAPGPDQTRRMVLLSEQRAYAIGMERKEGGSRCEEREKEHSALGKTHE